MIAARKATLLTVLILATLYLNHTWLANKVAKMEHEVQLKADPAEMRTSLPDNLRPLVRLDDFTVRYSYLVVPGVWILTFAMFALWARARARPEGAATATSRGLIGDSPGRPAEDRDIDPRA